MRPAKTQISLGIYPVWSESLQCTPWVAKDPRFLHVDSEDSDHTGWMPRLIWVFAGCAGHFVGFVMNYKFRKTEILFYQISKPKFCNHFLELTTYSLLVSSNMRNLNTLFNIYMLHIISPITYILHDLHAKLVIPGMCNLERWKIRCTSIMQYIYSFPIGQVQLLFCKTYLVKFSSHYF